MELIGIIVWALILSAIAKSVKKKNQNASAKKNTKAAFAPEPAASPARAAAPAPAKAASAPVKAAAPAAAKAAEKRVPSVMAEGFGTEGASAHHPFTDSFTVGHSHEETSMTGFRECPPEKPHEKSVKAEEDHVAAETPAAAPVFAFSGKDAVRAVVYAEILGKPKALRRG